ncbi:unnamed protein product [Cuscuta europaea]|uniref:Uncharacterized protein n=1 Tax=Cuscuta europaea TaxID=41803 RepID=A0A9P1ECT0_CUSEU|nr:unnamed protein product [Cuscuta europaea]
MNVDASYLPGKAGDGAIVGNQEGVLILAMSFPILATSSLEAEVMAVVEATRWAISARIETNLIKNACLIICRLKCSRIFHDVLCIILPSLYS